MIEALPEPGHRRMPYSQGRASLNRRAAVCGRSALTEGLAMQTGGRN